MIHVRSRLSALRYWRLALALLVLLAGTSTVLSDEKPAREDSPKGMRVFVRGRTQRTVGPSWLPATRPARLGQKASLVEACMPAYLAPTFEPERTTPPGNGMMILGTWRIAATKLAQPHSRATCGLLICAMTCASRINRSPSTPAVAWLFRRSFTATFCCNCW